MLRNAVRQYEKISGKKSIAIRRFANFLIQGGGYRKNPRQSIKTWKKNSSRKEALAKLRDESRKRTMKAVREEKRSNWKTRYPKIVDILKKSDCKIITLQEIEPHIAIDLKKKLLGIYSVFYTKHPKRLDGVAILVHNDMEFIKEEELRGEYVNSLLVTIRIGSRVFTICSTHQKGQIMGQLSSLLDSVDQFDNLILGGDFNTDFSAPEKNIKYQEINKNDKSLLKLHNLWHDPKRSLLGLGDNDSRPPHKQNPATQSSGMGCVDWLFARFGNKKLETYYDEKCRGNIVRSRNVGGDKWLSDHDFHCVCVNIDGKKMHIGQYNILCDVYGIKWSEYEAYY